MVKSLNELLSTISALERSNAKYYKLNDLYHVLSNMSGEELEVNDTILTPFYICDLGILEIYDYELNIRLVDRPSVESFILTKTGKESINEVNSEINEKLRSCYLELVKPQKHLSTGRIEKFVDYVRTSFEVKERIREYLHEFDDNKLYFEIY